MFPSSLPSYQTSSPLGSFLLLFTVLIVNYFSVWRWSTTPVIAAFPIILSTLLFLWYSRSWKLCIVAVLFAIGGAGQEAFFITQGLWQYNTASFYSIPVYLPFVWANIGILAASLYRGMLEFKDVFGWYHAPPPFRYAALTTMVAIGIVLTGIHIWADQPTYLLMFFLSIDLAYIILMRSVPLVIVGFIAMLMGSIADLVAVPLGLWHYPTSGLIAGIPSYIFLGWDIVGLLAAGLYLTLDTWSPHPAVRT